MSDSEIVYIDYTNHRGERAWRKIKPHDWEFCSTEWHPERQWILHAMDYDKEAVRGFALSSIHAWSSSSPTAVDMALAKQLQRSMERNARMVNRLQRLKSSDQLWSDGAAPKGSLDGLDRLAAINQRIDAILKDEEPTW